LKKEKLHVGIAGYGLVGKRRRIFIDQHPQMQTVAVCDQTFNETGVMRDGLRYYSHYRQLLEEKLDILFVSLPVYIAPEVTIAGCGSSGKSFEVQEKISSSQIEIWF